MIKENTLFILGAGASKPYGYPTGKELRAYICKKLPGIFSAIIGKDRELGNPDRVILNKDMKKFAEIFKKSSIQSVDQFLALNPSFSDIGRMAIATAILGYENRPRFNMEVEDSFQDWYSFLYKRMTEGFSSKESWKEFKKNNISFVTFNYDRSLEHFTYTSFIHSFWEIKDAILLHNYTEYIPFPFVHVYGQIDNPVWKGGSKYAEGYDDYQRIDTLKDNIRIIGDRVKGLKEDIAALFNKATRIFFLGFGYAPENMEVLGLPKSIQDGQEIYGTAKGYTKKEIEDLRTVLQKGFSHQDLSYNNPYIKNLNSYELLREYL
jgi:hypothetical protein